MTRTDGKPYTQFALRKIKLREGEVAMIKAAGWKFDGLHWINPRSGLRYPKRVAVDIEELRESAGRNGDNKPVVRNLWKRSKLAGGSIPNINGVPLRAKYNNKEYENEKTK